MPVFQPERIRRPEVVEQLAESAADAMVVVGYGQIIPQSIIDIPPLRHHQCACVAAAEVSRRGADPVGHRQRGDRTGVTTMRIDAGLDTGDMLLQRRNRNRPGGDRDRARGTARRDGCGPAGRNAGAPRAGTIAPQKQDPAQATLAPILKKEDGRIDWRRPAAAIHNRVRGLLPWPGAYTMFRGQTLHIWNARLGQAATCDARPRSGSWKAAARRRAATASLELLEVQLEGKKRISGEDFANGQTIAGE